jgi:hypothetical protein
MRRWTLRLEQRLLLYNDNLAQSELGDPLANSLTEAANRSTRSQQSLGRLARQRAGGRRVDVGADLYNVFSGNFATAYEQTYEYQTNGAAWLQPTSIAAPRPARRHVTLSF